MAMQALDPSQSVWMKKLQGGELTPQEEMALNSSVSMSPDEASAPSPLQIGGQPQASQPSDTLPLSMAAADSPGLLNHPLVQSLLLNSQAQQAPAPVSSAEMAKLYKQANELPSIQEQRKGLGDYQDATQKLMQPQVNLAPLAALADSWTGSNLSKGYTPPSTNEKILSYSDELQKRREALSKSLTDAVNTSRMGLMQQRMLASLGNQGDRMVMKGAKDVDTELKPYRDVQESANRLAAELSTPTITRSQLAIANKTLANIISNSNSTGLGQSEKVELTSAQADLAAMVQRLTGETVDIGSRGLLKHIADMLSRTAATVGGNGLDRINSLRAGLDYVQNPVVKQSLGATFDNYTKRFSPGFKGSAATTVENIQKNQGILPSANASPAEKPKLSPEEWVKAGRPRQ